MSRIILMALALAVTVAGCNRFPDNGLQITANLLPDSSCFVRGEQEERLLRGLYDTSFTNPGSGQPTSYFVALQLASYLVSDNALEFQGVQNNIQVDNLDITLLLPDGSKLDLPGVVNPYRVSTSAVIPATTVGSDPTQDVAVAVGIPSEYRQALIDLGVDSVLLSIRAGGTTFGGFSQRSAPFVWPVDICDGCLEVPCGSDGLDESCLPGQDVWPYCVP